MLHTPHLARRGAALVFRRRVPTPLRDFFKSAFLAFSLETHLVAEGRRRAARATRLTDAAFSMLEACGGTMLDETTVQRVTIALARFEIEAAETQRAIAPARDRDAVEATLRLEAATRETLRAALVYRDYTAVAEPLRATLERLGLTVAPESEDWRLLARRAAIALMAVSEENERREQGYYQEGATILKAALASRPDCKTDPIPGSGITIVPTTPPAWTLPEPPVATTPQSHAETVGALSSPSASPPATPTAPVAFEDPGPGSPQVRSETSAPIAPARESSASSRPQPERAAPAPAPAPGLPRADVRFEELAEEYIAMRCAESPSWAKNSAPNLRSTVRMFVSVHGNRACGWFRKEHFEEYVSTLLGVPKHHDKGEHLPIREQIVAADAREAEALKRVDEMEAAGASRGEMEMARVKARIERLSVGTVYRHQQDLQRLIKYGVDEGAFAKNWMEKVIWKKTRLKELEREEKDNRRLPWGEKARALFASAKFVEPLKNPCDAMFWAPLIAYLAGLRSEEALQLKEQDIETVEGIPCLRIQKGDGQHLKTRAARRLVPIHPALIDLGLLDLVAHRRREGQEWLFPTLERSKARGRLTGPFSKAFTAYRIDERLYDPRRDFHSLRADFNVRLKRRGAPLEIRKRLLGHEMDDVTEVSYDPEGSPIAEFYDWIRRTPFDTGGIRRPFDPGHETSTGPSHRRLRLVG